MFINKDLLDFFASMAEKKKKKRDVFNTLAEDVDDLDIRERLLQISRNEQQHVDQLLKSMDLVNGGPYHDYSGRIEPQKPLIPLQLHPVGEEGGDHDSQSDVNESTSETVLPSINVSDEIPFNKTELEPVLAEAEINVSDENPFSKIELEPVLAEAEAGKEEGVIDSEQLDTAPNTLPGTESIQKPPVALIDENIALIKQAQQIDTISHLQPTSPQNFYHMNTSKHPLAEVFGFTTTDLSSKAQRYRSKRHCPFNNRVPNCTNEHSKNPLGVCSILYDNKPVITCPVRFRQEWLITDDAASFFFEEGVRWSSLTEVQLADAYGKSAGNIDVVLVAYDDAGKMVDFGAIDIQNAFISGDARDPFDFYMKDPKANSLMDWSAQSNYPQPDYVSAIRESLVPRLIFKGSILNSWNKKMAVAIDRNYFETLPNLVPVEKQDAEMAWFVYDLEMVSSEETERYELRRGKVVYTKFQQTLAALSASYPDNIDHFMKLLPELADR
jgi:hypothetical protein